MCQPLKVLIVDDERLIRNLLKIRINWQELGMEIAGEAASALEALTRIDEIVPDIIFTDICLPRMDGIEFSRVVTEKYPHIRIVVITGHDEFEYAKSCVKLGISDFVLKPINVQEITGIALRLKGKILEERNHLQEYELLKQKIKDSLPYLKEKFLNELIYGELCIEEIQEKMEYFGVNKNTSSNLFQVAVLEVWDKFGDTSFSNKEEAKILLSIKCVDLIKKFFQKDLYNHVFLDNSRKIVIIFNDPLLDIYECCEMFKIMLMNSLKCFLAIGIGTAHYGEENIKVSYKEAYEALNYKIVIGNNQVISYHDIDYAAENHSTNNQNKIEKLVFAIKAGISETEEELVEQLFGGISYQGNSTIDRARLDAFDLLSACLRIIMDFDIDMTDIWEQKSQPYNDIVKIDNLPEFKTYFKQLIYNIIGKLKCLNDTKTGKQVRQIQDYISDNLSNAELSLASISKEFYISSSHLSRIFKQETGQTIVEYITKLRIAKAEKLLKETEFKGYQIGEMIGIPDPHYFSILFKKYTGLSINTYRK